MAVSLPPPTPVPAVQHHPPQTASRAAAAVLLLAACLATLGVYAGSLTHPILLYDDWPILLDSWTWDATRASLWRPSNEHAMPLGRLSNWALIRLAGRPTALPLAAALHGPLALVVGLLLLYGFVRREFGHPVPALVAVVVFGISSVYWQAVAWFASSFSVPALDMMLLGLLAAQAWRRSGHWPYLVASAGACALAPGWFASGILAGPVCTLYLWLSAPEPFSGTGPRQPSWLRAAATGLAPTLGSAAFLAVSLPRTAEAILHLPHYEGKTAVQAFDPLRGAWTSCRSVVDNLIPGQLARHGVLCLPGWAVAVSLVVLTGVGVWWWRRAGQRRWIVLGLALIAANYLLIYSARAGWSYEEGMHSWSRYHLLAQLGLAFVVCGGWRPRSDRPEEQRLSRGQVWKFGLAIAVLLAVHGVRGWREGARDNRATMDVLERVEETDARCREHHVSAATAREALEPLPVPYWNEKANAWVLLRGSDSPRPLSTAEAKQLLAR